MSKGTDRRTVRIAPELWDAARAVTAERGETISDVVRRALTDYTSSGGAGDDDAASTTYGAGEIHGRCQFGC